MNVISKISVDLTRPNMGTRVNAVQGDGNTRSVDITLLSGGEPWKPPEGVEAAIAYRQPGGTKGLYNQLADGRKAIDISDNAATIILAPQMLTVPGTVQASIVFNDAQLNQLTTFPFSVSVAQNQYAGAQKVEDYIRLQWLEDKLDEYLRKAADSGAFDGNDGLSAYQVAVANGFVGTQVEWLASLHGKDGDSTEATAAALAAETAATNAEQHAAAAQKSAESVVTDVNQIKDDLSDLAPAGAAVGQLFRVAAISEDGKYTMEPVDMPSGGVTDVQVDGESIVSYGIAKLGVAYSGKTGLVNTHVSHGHYVDSAGRIYNMQASDSEILSRSNTYKIISPNNLDYAVKAAMCDGKGAAWTAEEQSAARYRMGIPGDYELIEKINLAEDIASLERNIEPDGTPYNFRSVLVYIFAAKTATFSGTSLYMLCNGNSIDSNSVTMIPNMKNLGYTCHIVLRANIAGGRVFGKSCFSRNVVYNAGDYASNSPCEMLREANYITSIKTMFGGSEVFPSGSIIKIYAVR